MLTTGENTNDSIQMKTGIRTTGSMLEVEEELRRSRNTVLGKKLPFIHSGTRLVAIPYTMPSM